MIPGRMGQKLLDVISYLEVHGEVSCTEIAKMFSVAPKVANKWAYRWCDLGWLKRKETGKALFVKGWKLLGQRESPVEGSPAARVLGVLLLMQRLSFVEVEGVLGSPREASKALRKLVRDGWVRLCRRDSYYEVAPDPFISGDLRKRIEKTMARIRAGDLIVEKIVRA